MNYVQDLLEQAPTALARPETDAVEIRDLDYWNGLVEGFADIDMEDRPRAAARFLTAAVAYSGDDRIAALLVLKLVKELDIEIRQDMFETESGVKCFKRIVEYATKNDMKRDEDYPRIVLGQDG